MKRTTNSALIATIYAGLVLGSDPSGANRLYDDYQKRKVTYEGRITLAQKDFAKIRDRLEWKHVVTQGKKGIDIGNNQFVKSHIELCGKTLNFAEAYSLRELGAVLKPLLDDNRLGKPAAAILLGKNGDNINAERWDGLNFEMSIGKLRLLDVHFSGFDSQTVMAECKGNPSRRLEYIEAIVKILADPAIRKENPLEVKNLLSLLSSLKAKEAVGTLVAYMFFDFKTGRDYRIMMGDSFDKGTYEYIPGTILALSKIGNDFFPLVMKRFADATQEERSMQVGGGGVFVYALCYLRRLNFTEAQAVEAIEKFILDKQINLSDTQKETLRDLIVVIKEKTYRPYYFSGDWAMKKETATRSE